MDYDRFAINYIPNKWKKNNNNTQVSLLEIARTKPPYEFETISSVWVVDVSVSVLHCTLDVIVVVIRWCSFFLFLFILH